MDNQENKNTGKYCFTYSAPTEKERKEIEDIRRQYLDSPKQSRKIEELKALDNQVKKPPAILALTLGIAGILVFGLGMSMVLVWSQVVGGGFVAAAGALAMLCAYPLYKLVLRLNKSKYREQILQLSGQLLNDCGEKTENKLK